MEFEEADHLTSIRHAIREICAQFPDDYWREKDSRHEFPWDYAGTDTTSITTRAVRAGDHDVVTGQKVWTSEAEESDRADRAMQTHGGFAYAREYNVGRYFLESRLMQIAPVPQEMVLNYVAEHVLRLPRSY